jgi:hypothetical protein
MKFKFEITQVVKDTELILIDNAMGDNQDLAIFTVKYRVRVNKKLSMDSQKVLWASDELDAYNKAKQIIKDKITSGRI